MSWAVDEVVVPRRQNEVLSERIAYLEGKLSVLAEECPLEWKLTKSEGRLMGLLVRASGRVVAYNTMIAAMWDIDEPGNARNVLYVFVGRIRKKVAPYGVTIRTVYELGFRVERVLADLQAAQ